MCNFLTVACEAGHTYTHDTFKVPCKEPCTEECLEGTAELEDMQITMTECSGKKCSDGLKKYAESVIAHHEQAASNKKKSGGVFSWFKNALGANGNVNSGKVVDDYNWVEVVGGPNDKLEVKQVKPILPQTGTQARTKNISAKKEDTQSMERSAALISKAAVESNDGQKKMSEAPKPIRAPAFAARPFLTSIDPSKVEGYVAAAKAKESPAQEQSKNQEPAAEVEIPTEVNRGVSIEQGPTKPLAPHVRAALKKAAEASAPAARTPATSAPLPPHVRAEMKKRGLLQ